MHLQIRTAMVSKAPASAAASGATAGSGAVDASPARLLDAMLSLLQSLASCQAVCACLGNGWMPTLLQLLRDGSASVATRVLRILRVVLPLTPPTEPLNEDHADDDALATMPLP